MTRLCHMTNFSTVPRQLSGFSYSLLDLRMGRKSSSKPQVKISHPSISNRHSSGSIRFSTTIHLDRHRRPRQTTTSRQNFNDATPEDAPQCEHIDDFIALPDDEDLVIHTNTMDEDPPVYEHQVPPPPDKKPPVSPSVCWVELRLRTYFSLVLVKTGSLTETSTLMSYCVGMALVRTRGYHV